MTGDDAVGITVMLLGILLVGVLGWWVARRGASGTTGPNSLIGFRTRATLASDAAWQIGHLAALPLARTGLVVSISAVAAVIAATLLRGPAIGAVVGLVGLAAVTAVVIASCRRANSAAKQIGELGAQDAALRAAAAARARGEDAEP